MNEITAILREELDSKGIIPFSRFMEVALYCPEYGYYERQSGKVGREGDFYTSVSVGSLFGEMLAFQFAEWLEQLPVAPVQLVEAGAHDGKLAADILKWIRDRRPALFDRLEYVSLEPSHRRWSWQQETLKSSGVNVRRGQPVSKSAAEKFRGIIFSNELLDAFPIHRIAWDGKQRNWFEWGVCWENEHFGWARMSQISPDIYLPELPSELLEILPDGFTTEVCPAASEWWENAGNMLAAGRLLTFDYGLATEEFFTPQRQNGTLRAYRQHKLSDNVLAFPGAQDLTAHVNFSEIQKAGERAGLKTVSTGTQAEFLVNVAKNFWPEAQAAGQWTSQRNREFQTLMHPEHLGRAFRVLAQCR